MEGIINKQTKQERVDTSNQLSCKKKVTINNHAHALCQVHDATTPRPEAKDPTLLVAFVL